MEMVGTEFAARIFEHEREFCGELTDIASRHFHAMTDMCLELGIRRSSLVRQIHVINHTLFRKLRIRYGRSDPQSDFTLTQTVGLGFGNCLGLTVTYAAIAATLGVPVKPLLFEGHVAMCFELDGVSRPIEVSRGGSILTEIAARIMYKRKGRSQVISLRQLVAVHMANYAVFVCTNRDYQNAIGVLERVVKEFPEYVGARINLASMFLYLGEQAQAKQHLDQAVSLAPKGPYLRQAMQMLEQIDNPNTWPFVSFRP